ncbi:MAG: AmmeMemoRadiSam system protein B, partial [Deltaproteobacteria bacterium]|nr:AmmeMemoRadiSam system protein B [Deltaproteobacteria bacterium]
TSPQVENLVSIIVPHAGYRYSGQVAAHGYRLLENRSFQTVVVVGPSHRAVFKGVSVYDRGGYKTPLGIVPIDRKIIEEIKQTDPGIRYVYKAHAMEHCIEIQLPFIKMLLPNARLVPLLMGDQQYETCLKLADTLARCIRGKSALLVASTDLSHFHPYHEAKKLDARVLQRVEEMDPVGLYSDLKKGISEACGGGPMVAVMLASRLLGVNVSRVLFAANSGDVTGDRSQVVGYMAAALWVKSKK